MFWILLVVGIVIAFIGVLLWSKNMPKDGKAVIIIGVAVVILGFFTPQGKMALKKLWAGSTSSEWLIIDNSGGETMRHWVLEGGYAESSSQSDGWQFYDNEGNLCYVSGDAFVMKINQPLEEFLKTYKDMYNIPKDQVALK